MIRILLDAWPVVVPCIAFSAGFAVAVVLAGRGHGQLIEQLRRCRDNRDAWRSRALAAEADQRTRDRIAQLLPLTYAASAADRRRGISIVQGGHR